MGPSFQDQLFIDELRVHFVDPPGTAGNPLPSSPEVPVDFDKSISKIHGSDPGNSIYCGLILGVMDLLENNLIDSHPNLAEISREARSQNVSLFDLVYLGFSAGCFRSMPELFHLFRASEEGRVELLGGPQCTGFQSLIIDGDRRGANGNTKGYTFYNEEKKRFQLELVPSYCVTVLGLLPPKLTRGSNGADFVASYNPEIELAPVNLSVKSVGVKSPLLHVESKNHLKQIGKIAAFLDQSKHAPGVKHKILFFIAEWDQEKSKQIKNSVIEVLSKRQIDIGACQFIAPQQLWDLGIKVSTIEEEGKTDPVLYLDIPELVPAKWLTGAVRNGMFDKFCALEEEYQRENRDRLPPHNPGQLFRPEFAIFDMIPQLKRYLPIICDITDRSVPQIANILLQQPETQCCAGSQLIRDFMNDVSLRVRIETTPGTNPGPEIEFLRDFFQRFALNEFSIL